MDLRKFIDENVECVDTPNGKYLNREQVFESIKLVEEKLISTNKSSFQFPNIKEVITGAMREFQMGYLSNNDDKLISYVYNFIVGNKKH